jgi:transcriptional regulator with GAF, ATPase, and Fis domain
VHSAPVYQPDLSDGVLLRQLLPVVTWNSCACMPLAEREEVLAVLTIVSEKRNAFGPKVIEDVIPLKSMAALVLARHLHHADRHFVGPDDEAVRRAAREFQERIEQITMHARELEQELVTEVAHVDTLTRQIEELDRGSLEYRGEMDRVRDELQALEDRRAKASENLSAASEQLGLAESRIGDLTRTHQFVREVFDLLAGEHDPRQFPNQMLEWMSGHLGVGRCSVMLVDRSGYLLRVAFQTGLDPAVAERVRVRIGQGVAGWVALHRKPLLVQARDEVPEIERQNPGDYNTDSFVCAPIVYNGRLAGVLNLSNRADGRPFDASDLDRAVLAAGLFAITLGANEVVRRALAWAA